jgi:hypothetical protein
MAEYLNHNLNSIESLGWILHLLSNMIHINLRNKKSYDTHLKYLYAFMFLAHIYYEHQTMK